MIKLITYHNQYLMAFCITIAGVGVVSCLKSDDASKTNSGSGAAQDPSDSHSEDMPAFNAVAGEETRRVADFFYNIMKYPMEERLNTLSQSGEAKFIPYSGAWYPDIQGGTNVSGALSKYDKLYGSKAALWESALSGHGRAPDDPDRNWAGHCNGLAGSSSRHAEPTKAVKIGSVTFEPSDIKALLAEIYMSASFLSLGGLRCTNAQPGTNPYARPDPERMGDCEDVNPGSFHLAVTNMLGGREHLPLLFDMSLGNQVWNFAMYRYQCSNCTGSQWKEITRSQAQAIISGGSQGGDAYPFNRSAKKFYDVQLVIYYTDSLPQEEISRPAQKSEDYRYVLEVDGDGKIIGGEWSAANRTKHPDFVWMALQPVGGSGDERFANPHIEPEKVLNIWRESMRLAGKTDLFEGKDEPIWETAWGKFGDYTVLLDSTSSGAVFLGKKIKGEINLSSSRLDGAKLSVFLNRSEVGSFDVSKSNPSKFEVDPVEGVNSLGLYWEKGGKKESQDLRFYAVP